MTVPCRSEEGRTDRLGHVGKFLADSQIACVSEARA